MPETQQFDVVVIGGGSGLTAAYYAQKDGKSVALVTDRPEAMGGTCVNFGCIPTKTLIQSAEAMNTIRNAESFGIRLDQESVRVDFPGIMERMRAARAENAAGPRGWVEDAMTPCYGRARFVDDKLLELDDGRRVTGDRIFIAAGARAAVPPIEGLEEAGFLTNEEVLELDEQPSSLIIIGGGYIGAELGHFFASLGTEVTLINGAPRLLAEDVEVGDLFTREFGKKVALVTGRAVGVGREDGRKRIRIQGEDGKTATVTGDEILVATGRRPNTDGLGLEATGVACDDAGFVKVDDRLRTTHAEIYAYGDVVGRAMFKHTSSYEGELAYRNSQGADEAVSYDANPHGVFSDPQIGAVGLTERQCRVRGLRHKVVKKEYAQIAKGKIVGAPPGFAKLIVDPDSDRILGFHMIGPHAADLIHEVVVAMNAAGARAQLVRDTIHVHPTLPEMIRAVFDDAA